MFSNCCVNECRETPSPTVLPSVPAREAGNRNDYNCNDLNHDYHNSNDNDYNHNDHYCNYRDYNDNRNYDHYNDYTQPVTMLPPVPVRKAGNSSGCWSSSEECWSIECSETQSLPTMPSVLVRKAVVGSRLWSFTTAADFTIPGRDSIKTDATTNTSQNYYNDDNDYNDYNVHNYSEYNDYNNYND